MIRYAKLFRFTLFTLACAVLLNVSMEGRAYGDMFQTTCYNVKSVTTVGGVSSSSVAPGYCDTKIFPGSGGGQGSNGGATGGAFGGGGGYQTSVSGFLSALKNSQKAPPCLRIGDPIDPGTGAKVDAITDFALPGEMGLKFERYYMSRGVHGNVTGGPGWTDNLDFELHSISLGAGDPSSALVTYMRPDGSQLYFAQTYAAAQGTFLTGPFTEVGGAGLASLTYNGNGTYTLIDEDAQRYTWSEDTVSGTVTSNKGILTSIKDPSGIGWTITHPSSTVTQVTHTSAQYMTLTYGGGKFDRNRPSRK